MKLGGGGGAQFYLVAIVSFCPGQILRSCETTKSFIKLWIQNCHSSLHLVNAVTLLSQVTVC